METVPPATAVTSPDGVTVAIAVFEVLQATGNPVIELPNASLAVAVACVVCPTLRLEVPSTTPTFATVAAATVSEVAPMVPSTVALIAAEPIETAVTSPDGVTVATVVSELVQATARPVSTLPE